ncbi:MAG TPA: hypothetical protein VFV99_29590 [Kofleriaceae bacterium]|nr:hypothetical protein [Kofleriaceae bacterium]
MELWRRDADGWQRNDVTSGLVQLEAIDCTLAIDDVYYDPLATD